MAWSKLIVPGVVRDCCIGDERRKICLALASVLGAPAMNSITAADDDDDEATLWSDTLSTLLKLMMAVVDDFEHRNAAPVVVDDAGEAHFLGAARFLLFHLAFCIGKRFVL